MTATVPPPPFESPVPGPAGRVELPPGVADHGRAVGPAASLVVYVALMAGHRRVRAYGAYRAVPKFWVQ
ncbi:hypothetical protein WJ438_07085 [Streptomyces sp. GD-15H]|uniref:hypothetical protein n=1 Tax=Streptomyces sp. GD-15H TaxID=3129112 RepID=UPI00325325BC